MTLRELAYYLQQLVREHPEASDTEVFFQAFTYEGVKEECPGLTRQEWEYWLTNNTTYIPALTNTKTRKDLNELWENSLMDRLRTDIEDVRKKIRRNEEEVRDHQGEICGSPAPKHKHKEMTMTDEAFEEMIEALKRQAKEAAARWGAEIVGLRDTMGELRFKQWCADQGLNPEAVSYAMKAYDDAIKAYEESEKSDPAEMTHEDLLKYVEDLIPDEGWQERNKDKRYWVNPKYPDYTITESVATKSFDVWLTSNQDLDREVSIALDIPTFALAVSAIMRDMQRMSG